VGGKEREKGERTRRERVGELRDTTGTARRAKKSSHVANIHMHPHVYKNIHT